MGYNSRSRSRGRRETRRRSRSKSRGRRDSRDRGRGGGGGRGRDGKISGTVTAWRNDRGFGFIRPNDGGADIFVHVRELHDGNALRTGSDVQFEEGYDEKARKPQAVRVTGAIRERSFQRDEPGGYRRSRSR